MKLKTSSLLCIGYLLVIGPLADLAEAGGRGSRGGGGFSRGGGGGSFSRGGAGGGFGSIRNSSHRSSWGAYRPSGADLSRPSMGAGSRPSRGQMPDQRPSQQPARERDRAGLGQQPAQLPSAGSGARPVQQPAGQRDALPQRPKNLTPDQKDQLRQKFENSGLQPSQLPSRDREQIREDWEGNREDWQDWRDDAREDWQNWYEDQYDDYWDDGWYASWWYGYPISTVSYSFYFDDTPPCHKSVMIHQATGSTTYYYCSSIWYQPTFAAGEVTYVVTSPPAGGELDAIPPSYAVTVDGQEYFVSNHVFYQQITRDGQTLYVTVDAPTGANVPTIPEYAVEIELQGQSYYRFDRIFYQRQANLFVVVANPGV